MLFADFLQNLKDLKGEVDYIKAKLDAAPPPAPPTPPGETTPEMDQALADLTASVAAVQAKVPETPIITP